MKPTFLFYNESGNWESVAIRIKSEGYPIYYYKKKGMIKGREDTGEGIFDKEEIVDDLYKCLYEFRNRKNELIILVDDNGHGCEADYLRSEGWKVIGGSSWGDHIEYERSSGLDLMLQIGLDVPYEKDFTSIKDGITFVEGEDEDARYVFKPEGEDFAGGAKTYTSKNRQDLIDYLKWIQSDCVEKHYDVNKFVLQEFVEGIEADFSAYFNGHDFINGLVIIDIEEKKSGDGNKGEAVGCMGNIVLNVGTCKYYTDFLNKLIPILRENKYVGQISINNIFSSKTQGKHKEYKEGMPYGLEFTSRFGWDAHTTELAILKESGKSIAEFYISLVNEDQFSFPVGKVGCGVRVYTGSISLKKEDVAGRLFSFAKEIAKNLWFYSVSRKKGNFIIEDNPVLVVNTVGKNLKNTISDCYQILKDQVNIPDVYYRMEIGQRAEEVLKFLKQYSWI